LFLSESKADSIEDDELSWTKVDKFDVTGCQYGTFIKLSDSDVGWRLRELDSQYARINISSGWPDLSLAVMRLCHRLRGVLPAKTALLGERIRELVKEFKPQPYIQLALIFRSEGFEAAAKKILVRLERNKTRYGDIGFFPQIWRYMLDIFLRYGYSPFRPVLILLVWATFSAALFQAGYDSKQILPTKDNATDLPSTNPDPRPRVAFNAIVYSIDTLVPIVDLNQKKNWTVPAFSSLAPGPQQRLSLWEEIKVAWRTIPDQWLAILLIFNTFFGWLMTTLFAAGVTGLLRIGKDM